MEKKTKSIMVIIIYAFMTNFLEETHEVALHNIPKWSYNNARFVILN